MSADPKFGWPWFRDEIAKGVAFSESHCRDLLGLVEEMDNLVGAILARPTSPSSERPQDFVVSLLVARAFRLTVSSLYIGLGGYPDSEQNLQRTVWEIGVRLLDIMSAPVHAAFGYILDGLASEIARMEAELEHRRAASEPVHQLPANLDAYRKEFADLSAAAQARDLAPELVRRRHGRLNIREVCKRFGIEKAYLVDYASASNYVHEKGAAAGGYMEDVAQGRRFHLGPIGVLGGPTTIAIDGLTNFARVLAVATRVVEDEPLVQQADGLSGRLAEIRMRLDSETFPLKDW